MSLKGINKVILIGYLGQDPNIKYMDNGNIMTIVSLATSENWKNKKTGEINQKTEWHRIIFFGKLAEISSELLKKGNLVYIEGKLQYRKWKDDNNNNKYITEIIVSNNGIMRLLNSKNITDDNIKKDNIKSDNFNEYDDKENIDFIIKDNLEDDISF